MFRCNTQWKIEEKIAKIYIWSPIQRVVDNVKIIMILSQTCDDDCDDFGKDDKDENDDDNDDVDFVKW